MNNITSGILFMLSSSFFFALMNAFAKQLSIDGMPSMENVFFRSSVMVLVILGIYVFNFARHAPRKTYKKGGWINLLMRVIMGSLSMMCIFYNIATISLGTTMAFSQTTPIYVVILGFLFLKEKLTLPIILATTVGFIGILLISNPSFNGISLVNVAVGIFSGLSMAVAFVTLKSLKDYFDNLFIILAFGVSNSMLGLLGMFLPFHGVGGFIVPSANEWILIIFLGLSGTLGQHFLNKAYLNSPVSIVAPIDYTRIIFSLAFGIFLGDSFPNLTTTGGIILIILSGILIVMPSLLEDIRRLKKRG